MTREQIEAMPAGIEMNQAIAENIFGLIVDGYHTTQKDIPNYMELRPYSNDLVAAWEVVEKIKKNQKYNGDFAIHYNPHDHGRNAATWYAGYFNHGYDNCFDFSASAETAPLAICRVALLTKKYE